MRDFKSFKTGSLVAHPLLFNWSEMQNVHTALPILWIQ